MNDNDIIINEDFIINTSFELLPIATDYSILNQQQYEAVKNIEGYILILAGAGTGKSTTLAYRVAYLLENNVQPDKILLLTFTNSAASSIRGKVQELLQAQDNFVNGIKACTFHFLAYELLQKYCSELNGFTVIDSKDSEDIIDLMKSELKISSKDKMFPSKQLLNQIYSMSSNRMLLTDVIIKEYFPEYKSEVVRILKIYNKYQKYKEDNKQLNFDDLLQVLHDKLKNDIEFRNLIQDKYKYVLIDEFQDTNPIQNKIVEIIAQKHTNLCVVGDDAQAIFGFTGADSENILGFPDRHPECKIIKLEQNYRSNNNILNLTNDFTRQFNEGYRKRLYSDIHTTNKPILLINNSDIAEAVNILNTIGAIKQKKGDNFSFDDIAILYRDSYHSNQLQFLLLKEKIPFRVRGGTKFNERKHIRDILAHLKVKVNPGDKVSWTRILKLIPGIGNKSAAKIIASIAENKNVLKAKKFSDKGYYEKLAALEYELKCFFYSDFNLYKAVEDICYYYHTVAGVRDENYASRENDIITLLKILKGHNSLERFLGDFALTYNQR